MALEEQGQRKEFSIYSEEIQNRLLCTHLVLMGDLNISTLAEKERTQGTDLKMTEATCPHFPYINEGRGKPTRHCGVKIIQYFVADTISPTNSSIMNKFSLKTLY